MVILNHVIPYAYSLKATFCFSKFTKVLFAYLFEQFLLIGSWYNQMSQNFLLSSKVSSGSKLIDSKIFFRVLLTSFKLSASSRNFD
jgi:hypothetical protein